VVHSDMNVSDIRAFLLDMDGVVYRGDAPLPGAQAFVSRLQSDHVPFLFVTNNSTRTPQQYVDKLASVGIDITPETVLTSALATAGYLARSAPAGSRVLVVGEIGLVRALEQQGFVVTENHAEAEIVVAGFDSGVTWDKLARATLAIRRGARFVATNPDRTLPSEEGLVPGAGSILAAIEAASDVAPEVVGKPESTIYEQALSILGTDRSSTAMVGDRLDTDILGARRMGLPTIGVLTGVSTAEELVEGGTDWVFPDLAGLLAAWRPDSLIA
jgi:4-nitrophenyl phosphatase